MPPLRPARRWARSPGIARIPDRDSDVLKVISRSTFDLQPEQRLRLFQIGGIEPLGEPAIDRREKIASFATAALLGPQPAH